MEQAVGDIKTDNQNEETIGSGESWYDERNLVVSHQQEIQPSYCKFENDIGKFLILTIVDIYLVQILT